MAQFTVHETKSGNPLLIKEGFSWVALVLPIVWPILYGQVGSFLILLLLNLLIAALAVMFDLPIFVLGGLLFALNLLVAFEANNWRRQRANAKGNSAIALSEGRSLSAARAAFVSQQEARAPFENESANPAPQIKDIQRDFAHRQASSAEESLWSVLGLRDRPYIADSGHFGPPEFTDRHRRSDDLKSISKTPVRRSRRKRK